MATNAQFNPRTSRQAATEWLARVIARTVLTDAVQGSVISGIAGAVGDEVERMENAIDGLKRSHWLDASGDLLDERCGDMPPGFQTRLGATAATTDSLLLTLADSTSPTLIPAGTVYARKDNPSVVYVQAGDVTAAAHQTSYPGGGDPPVRVVASALGVIGNCAVPGLINLVQTPVNGLLACTSQAAVSTGTDRETDAQLRIRASAYMQSLAGVTSPALLYLALTFQASNGVRMKHATVWTDPRFPAYAELLIDDGTGLTGYTTPGPTLTGTIGANGVTQLFHAAPATAPISNGQLLRNGVAPPLGTSGNVQWVSVQEKGVLYPDASLFAPGNTWAIGGYTIFTGPIAEIQAAVNGDLSQWWQAFGKCPSGGRVVVRPPDVATLDLTAQLVMVTGANVPQTQALVGAEFDAYLADVAPGQPFRGSIFYQRVLDNVPAVTSMIVTLPASVDAYPPTDRTRFVRGTVKFS